MVILELISFWTSVISSIFILLHIPSCNIHWANRLKPFSKYLKKYHNLTLNLAAAFALIHVIIIFVELIL
ncbi:hypothetical protein HN840_01925 [archaeon]|jgi:hypothetical protein|nr:hypothetical protein [archaeon]MBT3730487.1 hypothetical protein [archaeon]MBT4669447.1 hypothetical protein [archaeon]MBT5029800.1 hypothetical protein [archaeon]MBT5288013.1 hypothetical protein [archaeon]